MDSSWISLLIQIPLVAFFGWYSLEMNKRSAESQKIYMEALDKRDQEYEKRNNALITAINSLATSITQEIRTIVDCQNEHDKFVRENVSRKEVTKRNNRTTTSQ